MKIFIYRLTVGFLATMISTAWAEPLMYVPAGDSNELLVIDLQNGQIKKKIGELENSHGLAAVPSQEYLVAGSMDTKKTKSKKKSVKPEKMSDEEHKSHHSGKEPAAPSYVSIVHPEHGHVMRRVSVKDRTHHIAVDPSGKYAVGTHNNMGGVSVVDLNKMETVHYVKTGQVSNYALFTNDGSRLYVSNAGSGTVTEVDTSNWKIIKDIPVGKGPEHMALDQKNEHLYVLNVISGTVSDIDLNKGEVARTFKVGKSPHGLALSGKETNLFVSNKGSGTLTNINLSTAQDSSITLSPAPYHVTYVKAVDKLYVASRKQPKIWVINPHNMKVEGEISLGSKGVAHQMVVK